MKPPLKPPPAAAIIGQTSTRIYQPPAQANWDEYAKFALTQGEFERFQSLAEKSRLATGGYATASITPLATCLRRNPPRIIPAELRRDIDLPEEPS